MSILKKIQEELESQFEDPYGNIPLGLNALRAVVELHNEDVGCPDDQPISVCDHCKVAYPCPTIQAIERELE